MPYVEDVANVMVPLIKFQYYEGVRSSAALCIPKLLRALVVGLRKGGHPQNTTMQLLTFSLAPLLEQLKKETDEECRGCLAEAISGCMMVLYESGGTDPATGAQLPAIIKLPETHINAVVGEILIAAKASVQRRIDAEVQAKKSDWDEESELALEESLELEEELMSELVDAHGYILKTVGPTFLPTFSTLSAPFFKTLLPVGTHHSLACSAVCVFDDAIEFIGEGAHAYLDISLPAFLHYAQSEHPILRQASVYGLSQASKHAVVGFRNIAPQALQLALALVAAEDSRSEDYENATDNAIAAVGNILEYHGEALASMMDVMNIWTMWLSWLPLRVDEIETIIVNRQVVKLAETGHVGLMGAAQCNVPLIMNALTTALVGSEGGGEEVLDFADEPLKRRIGQLLNNFKVGVVDAAVLAEGWARLSPEQQSAANKWM